MAGEEHHISWIVTTHNHSERSVDWYWALGLVVAVAAAACIWFGDFLFALMLLIGGFCVGFLAARGPREHQVAVTERGINIDGTLYRWSGVKSFWVERDMAAPHLFLTLSGFLTPHLMLRLDDHGQAEAVRAHLIRFVNEEEQAPHVGEHIAQMLGL
ncbi:MAG: hypothetical protein KGI70_03645 [Patescibacteria group bacterium]|nr:hypothetical protein [Patescibacteria group bacterium]